MKTKEIEIGKQLPENLRKAFDGQIVKSDYEKIAANIKWAVSSSTIREVMDGAKLTEKNIVCVPAILDYAKQKAQQIEAQQRTVRKMAESYQKTA